MMTVYCCDFYLKTLENLCPFSKVNFELLRRRVKADLINCVKFVGIQAVPVTLVTVRYRLPVGSDIRRGWSIFLADRFSLLDCVRTENLNNYVTTAGWLPQCPTTARGGSPTSAGGAAAGRLM